MMNHFTSRWTAPPQLASTPAHRARWVGQRLFTSRYLWVWPIIASVGLLLLGSWVNRSVEFILKERVAGEIETILNADVEALTGWIHQEQRAVEILASDRQVVGLAHQIIFDAPQDPRIQAQFQELMASRLRSLQCDEFFVVDLRGVVRVTSGNLMANLSLPSEVLGVLDAVTYGKSVMSLPFRCSHPVRQVDGNWLGEQERIVFAAPLVEETDIPFAAFCVRVRPDADFTRILQLARAGETGETYAIDVQGRLLSQSRFDSDLKRIGLLPDAPGVHSLLRLDIRDPGGDLTQQYQPESPRLRQPLTLAAESLVRGEWGRNVDGYRDYRGVPVVGAWKWLEPYGFGVITEIDVAEAYRSLGFIRTALLVLLGTLIACSVIIFLCLVIMDRQRQAMQAAAIQARAMGQYRLGEPIGQGGMGTVYRVQHQFLRRPTALKLIQTASVTDAAVQRFEREVQLTAELQHPNTIRIYDYGRTPEGIFYYAMEYLDGLDLERLVEQNGPLPEGRIIEILRQVCGSLEEAHGRGLVHRDIKPANIFLGNHGGIPDFVKVLDFGLVKDLTDSPHRDPGSLGIHGTPHFLAPEAIEQPETVDRRADLYSLGAVAYYLLTGCNVFSAKTLIEVCTAQVRHTPESPSRRLGRKVSAGLERIILRCLEKKPGDRFANARDLAEALTGCASRTPWGPREAEAWWLNYRRQTESAPGTESPITPPETVPMGRSCSTQPETIEHHPRAGSHHSISD